MEEYNFFYSNIAKEFCDDKKECGIELIYKQIIDGSVISTLEPELENFLILNLELGTNYYPFNKTPEMIFYFEEEFLNRMNKKKSMKELYKFKDYSPSINQLDRLINPLSEYCLLSPNNSISLLHLNKTEDKDKQIKYYLDLEYDKIFFLSQYFYSYLPSVFLYPEINTKGVTIQPEAKTMTVMTKKIIESIYKNFSNINLYEVVLKKVVFNELFNKMKALNVDEVCTTMMQKILDDGKKVMKICSDEKIGFKSEDSLNKWMEPYYCYYETNHSEKCNMELINYLKKLVYISESEIKKYIVKNT